MSGHSKWNNIKRKKEKTDGARAKIFTKIGRELAVAVREGGSADPNANSKLKDCIAKAKANNVPNDNIERIIKKAAGDGNSEQYRPGRLHHLWQLRAVRSHHVRRLRPVRHCGDRGDADRQPQPYGRRYSPLF